MHFKKLTLILSSTIALAACNGPTSETQSNKSKEINKSNEMVPNPRIVGNSSKASSKSLLAEDSNPAFIKVNKNVEIGDGYNPDTKQVLKVTINDKLFAYANDDDAVSPISKSKCDQQNYAKELGGMSASSSNQIFGVSITGAANVGLYKAALAGSFNKETATDETQLRISKIFGAAISCDIDTIVVGDSSTENYEHMQEALINSSSFIRTAILKIRSSKTLFERQNAIKEFYKNYGTYMVSGVKVGQIALKEVKMTQKDSKTEGQSSAAAAASFSSPFASLEGSASFASAEKFTNAGWDIEISEYLYPNNTTLTTNLKDMQTEFENMKSGGIIDFTKLKPDPKEINADKITKPTIPPVEINTAAREELRMLKNNYNEFTTLIPSTQKEMNAKPSTRDEKITSYTKIITNLTTIQKDMDYIDGKINYLKTSEYNKYSTEYLPKVREWTSSNLSGKYQDLLKQTQDEGSQLLQSSGSKALTPQQIIKQINKVIASGESAVDIAESEATNKKSKDKEQIDLIKKFGVTYSRYEEKKFVEKFESEASAISLDRGWAKQYTQATNSGKLDVFRQWKAARILIAPTDTLKALQEFKQDWSAKFNPAPSVPLYVTKAEADEYEQEMHTVVKSQMLGGAGHNDDSTLYGADNIVMDFQVTPWSKIFPELTNTMAVDDSIEDNELTIVKEVKEYTKIYRYLKDMARLDKSSDLEKIRAGSQDTYNKMLELERSIQSAIGTTSSTITFKETNYDLSEPDAEKNLFDAISKLNSSSIMMESDWYKVVKQLYDHGLLGSFGSFLGFKPEYPVSMKKIGLLPAKFNELMTADQMNNTPDYYSWNDSGYKIYLDSLVKQRKGTATSKNDELPPGIFTTSRTQDKYYSLDSATYQSMYLFNESTNSVAKIVLTDLKQQNSRISGVIPAVLLSSGLDKSGNITKIGLLDSSGRIIGANPNQATNSAYDEKTLTYNLNLTTNYGKKETPAYELILNEGDGLVTEVNLKNRPEEWGRVNQILLGQGYAPEVWHAFQGEYTYHTGDRTSAFTCIYDNNQCWSDDRPGDNSTATRMNFKVTYDTLPPQNRSAKVTADYKYSIEGAKNIPFSKYLSSNLSHILGEGFDQRNQDDSSKITLTKNTTYIAKDYNNPAWQSSSGLWGVMHFNIAWCDKREELGEIMYITSWPSSRPTILKKIPGFGYGHERWKKAPYYQHKLMLIPVNKTVISEMRNVLDMTNQPLLPTYNY